MRCTKVKTRSRILAMVLSWVLVISLMPGSILPATAAYGENHSDVFTIRVTDAENNPISGAEVRIYNDGLADNSFDVTEETDDEGVAAFEEVAAASDTDGIEVNYVVSAKGYNIKEGVETVTADTAADRNVDVMLELAQPEVKTVSAAAGENGSITLNGSEEASITVNSGTKVQIGVTADEGYRISSVKIGEQEYEDASGLSEYAAEVEVTEDITVSAEFIKVWTVTVIHEGNGNVEIEPAAEGGVVTVETKEKVTIKASPQENFRVSQVVINGEIDDTVTGANDSGYSESLEVEKDYKIEITFSPNIYKVTAEDTENGTLEIANTDVNHGEDAKVILKPAEGFTVDSVLINGTAAASVIKDESGIYLVISNVTESKSITATFKQKEKAATESVDIDSTNALRTGNENNLFVIKQGTSITLSTEKDGIRVYGSGDTLIGGSESEKSVSISNSSVIEKIQVYYQAEGELYADWHDMELESEITISVDDGGITANLEPGEQANDNGYYNSDVTFNVLAEDTGNYSGIASVVYWITYGEMQDDAVTLYKYDGAGQIKNIYETAFTVDASRYNSAGVKVTLQIEDRAGNFEKIEKTININSTAPYVELDIDGEIAENAQPGYYNKSRTLTIAVTDREDTFDQDAATAGLKIKVNGKEVDSNIVWSTGDNPSIHTGIYTFAEDAEYEWTFSYTNKAGMSANISQPDAEDIYKFTIDRKAPQELSIDYAPTFSETILESVSFGFYKAPVKVTLKGTDETSGIENFTYSYTVQDGASQINEGKQDVVISRDEFTSKDNEASASFEIPAQFRGSVSFTATDRAGNTSTLDDSEKVIVVDNIAPGITVSYDNTSVQNDKYYDSDRTATIRIDEANFFQEDLEDKRLQIVVEKTTDDGVYTKTEVMPNFTKDEESLTNIYEGEVKFTEAGDYKLSINYTDRAGNPAGTYTDEFTIDKTAPQIEVSYNNNGYKNEKYYDADRTATIKVTEHNFYVQDLAVNVTQNGVENTEYSDYLGNKENWTQEGDVYTAEITFSEEADYTFEIVYSDPAGNPAEPYNAEFTIDKTAPQISVTYNNNEYKNEKYYDDDRTATITIIEENFNAADVKATITADGSEEIQYGDYLKKEESWKLTEEGYTAEIEFSKEADYTFEIVYSDPAGNPAMSYNTEFTIDKTDPEFTVAYNNNSCKNEDQFNQNRIATITIKEHNFSSNGVEVTINDEKVSGDELKWSSGGDTDTHTAEVPFTEEANYEVSFSCVDLAGRQNKAVDYGESVAPEKFTIDKTAPTNMQININGESVLSADETTVLFNKFYNERVEIELGADCGVSGKESFQYQKVSEESSYSENNEWEVYDETKGIIVDPNEKFIIYFRAEDRAGNVSIVNSTGIIVDNKAPEGENQPPEIDIDLSEPDNNGYYNDDVTVDFKVIDPKYSGSEENETGYYSGLSEITYRIYATDTGVEETGVLLENGRDLNGKELDVDEDGLIKSWNGSITVKADTFNSNNVIVEIKAKDNAGNSRISNTSAGDIKIDKTKPEIQVSYNNNNADSGRYFAGNRTATITITERNFRAEDVRLALTNTDGAVPSLSGWTKIPGSGNQDDTRWQAILSYTAEGDYTFGISYTDLAGLTCFSNEVDYGNSIAPTAFSIDKTVPRVSVTYNNNDARNTNYYRADRIATITITEHNLDPNGADRNRVSITMTATDDGNPSTVPTVSAWRTQGDTHTATIHYREDALYTFDISVRDKAGNQSADFAEQRFYIDKTAPSLEITGVSNNSANNGDVIPVVTYSDTNYDANQVRITLTGANRKNVALDGRYTDIHNGRTFIFNNFAREKFVDDIYTLTATLTDRAGNTTTETITFSVNRFGSTYALSSTAERLNGTYIQEPVDIVISETNVDELSNIRITLFKNNETIILKEGEDYRIDVEGGNGEWYHYTYTIFAKNFADDGVYRLSIHSEDSAGNVAENTLDIKNTEINFGVDKTAPALVISNLESGVTYALNNLTVRMFASDNLLLSSVIVYLDDYDTPYKVWDADEIAAIIAGDGEFSFDISGDSTHPHRVKIVCIDAAGNETVEEITNFYVTTNLFVRYYTNKPLFYGSIAGVILLVGLVVFLAVYKKKKNEKQ